ncbi:MAG: 4-hydroxythreonine-4-phosphate dehydrogenase PdxA, partial [Spirochaetia bacterium]|nr:4-hydroxythreonine-4-phosphate dehydrogenase PdxA [Spirochaetia bacterium]
MNTLPVLGILLGDGAGVGPEIVAKLAVADFYAKHCKPIIIGDARILARAFGIIGSSVPLQMIGAVEEADWKKGLPVLDQKNLDPKDAPLGKLTTVCGEANLLALAVAVNLYKEKKIEGFCFAPLNKAGMKDAGCKFESEHHFMADLFGHTEPFGEINVVGDLWTTRTTSHIPISEVSSHLTVESILRAVHLANTSIRNSGVAKPRLALAALNPHAGENGMCGRE